MYKIDKKFGNLSREIYINSNFAESLFLKFLNGSKMLRDPLDVYFGHIFPKMSEKKCCFLNNIFHKFENVVCFAPLLHGVEKNTILNSDRTDIMKSKNSIAWRKRGE